MLTRKAPERNRHKQRRRWVVAADTIICVVGSGE
jgi:hypothetical protein